jgi:hypothetical protein
MSTHTASASTQVSVGNFMQQILNGADSALSNKLNELTQAHSTASTRDASTFLANVAKDTWHNARLQLSKEASKFDSVMGTESPTQETSKAIHSFLADLRQVLDFQDEVLSSLERTLPTVVTVSFARGAGLAFTAADVHHLMRCSRKHPRGR